MCDFSALQANSSNQQLKKIENDIEMSQVSPYVTHARSRRRCGMKGGRDLHASLYIHHDNDITGKVGFLQGKPYMYPQKTIAFLIVSCKNMFGNQGTYIVMACFLNHETSSRDLHALLYIHHDNDITGKVGFLQGKPYMCPQKTIAFLIVSCKKYVRKSGYIHSNGMFLKPRNFKWNVKLQKKLYNIPEPGNVYKCGQETGCAISCVKVFSLTWNLNLMYYDASLTVIQAFVPQQQNWQFQAWNWQ